MNYKNIILAALLLPSFGYAKNEAHMKELQEAFFKKTFELKSLMQQIRTICYEYYVSNEVDKFLEKAIDQESEKIENRNSNKEELTKKVESRAEWLQELLRTAIFSNHNVEKEVEKTFLDPNASFTAFEAVYIEAVVEDLALSLLQEKAKKCLKELLILSKELRSLKS